MKQINYFLFKIKLDIEFFDKSLNFVISLPSQKFKLLSYNQQENRK